MPRLLKGGTQRRLSASQQALTLAFSLLGTPKPISHERADTDGSLEIGLIGIAADLALAACLFEVLGPGGILRQDSGFYLTAVEALASFRALATSTIPRVSVLTWGIAKQAEHLEKLKNATTGFQVIFSARAAAVHAGKGISRDAALHGGRTVIEFLLALAESPKWKPYLTSIPQSPVAFKDRTLIAQEPAKLIRSGDKSKVGPAITRIFLVLPELTKNEPDWLETLQRVQVTPKSNDISVLLKSLSTAQVGDLYKVGKGAGAIATKFDSADQNALPIYTGGMKKKFDNSLDEWTAYVGTANAQLDKGFLSLPPVEAIYMYSAMGVERIGLPEEEIVNGLAAHVIWPFIADALNYAGTKGPCFFLIRKLKVGEFGQFKALMKKAGDRSTKLKTTLEEYLPLFEVVVNDKAAPASSALASQLAQFLNVREEHHEGILDTLGARLDASSGKSKAAYEQLISDVEESGAVAVPLTRLIEGSIDLGTDLASSLRLLIDAAVDREDLPPVVALLGKSTFKSTVGTNARKAVRDIDYLYHGPQLVDSAGRH
jgi:hypothetical protein